jgi:hypothetical protein
MSALIFVFGFIAATAWMVWKADFGWWAPHLAELIIRVSVSLAPKPDRESRLAELLGELDEARRSGGPGVVFASVHLLSVGFRLRRAPHLPTSTNATRVTISGSPQAVRESVGTVEASVVAVTPVLVTSEAIERFRRGESALSLGMAANGVLRVRGAANLSGPLGLAAQRVLKVRGTAGPGVARGFEPQPGRRPIVLPSPTEHS